VGGVETVRREEAKRRGGRGADQDRQTDKLEFVEGREQREDPNEIWG
jgi:hypothetical protein